MITNTTRYYRGWARSHFVQTVRYRLVEQLTEWTNCSGILRQPLTIFSSIIEKMPPEREKNRRQYSK